jgi:hypothetical protein
VRAADAFEAIAVDLFKHADGRPITMTMIRSGLEQLRSRRPACTCGLSGETVAKARTDRMYQTAQIWQRSVIATRRAQCAEACQ